VKRATTPVAVYMNKYEATSPYLWDELAALAWIEPGMVRTEKRVYMDVDINHGHSYGDTLTWSEAVKPALPLQMVDVNMEVDAARFQAEYLKLMTTSAVVGERGK
jgi:purine nucleosidase